MKTRLKAMIPALAAAAFSIFLLVSGTVTASAAQYSEAEIKQTAAVVLSQCMQTDDAAYEALENVREAELDFALLQSGIPCEGKDYLSILTAWREGLEECGTYQGQQDLLALTDTFEVAERNGEIQLNGVMEFSDRDADVTFTFEKDGTVTALTIGAQYTPGEVMRKAGLNTVIGMGTVFVVLIFMSLLISCFRLVNRIQDGISKKKDTGKAPKEQLQLEAEEEIDEDVLYAITAAVCSELRINPLRDGE